MKHLNLIYRLDGDEEKIKNGLSVYEIAPILLSVGDLIRESNQTLFPEGRQIAVNVKPFQQGSFIIDIVLFAANNLQHIIDFVNLDGVKQIKELLEWIGMTVSGATSLLGAIKYLEGAPKIVEQLSPNEIKYTPKNGNSIIVPKQVHQLFQNCNIQNVVYNAIGKPLEQDGITKIQTYLEGEGEKAEFKKADSKFFKVFSQAEIPTLEVEEVISTNMEVFLVPKRGSFDGDPRQWSFHMGQTVIKATIKDSEFLDKIKKGALRINHTDVLQVQLIQKIKKINNKLDPNSVTFEVDKVLEYQKGSDSTQAKINLDSRGEK